MALTTRGDGTGAAFQISSGWFNDFKDLLTGVMTDQPVTLNYRPGSGSTPTLSLKTDGRPLIKGYKTDNTTQAFQVDQNGNAAFAGTLTIVGAVSGVTTLAMSGALSGATSGTFSSYVEASYFRGPSGGSASFQVYDNAVGTLRAIRIFIGTTDPSTYTTVNEGDIWIKA